MRNRRVPSGLRRVVALAAAALLTAAPSLSTARADDPAPSNDELVAKGEELFFSTTAFGQRPSQGPMVAGQVLSCASCHPAPGFTDGRNHVVGPVATRAVAVRQTPHLLRIGNEPFMSWDGRNTTIQAQSLGAITSALEMNSARLPTQEELDAIAAYVKTIDAPDAVPYKDFDPVRAKRGEALFDTPRGIDALGGEFPLDQKVACGSCHTGPNRSDGKFHRILFPQGDPLVDPGRVGSDGAIEGFKTPVLRGVRLTAPYFHEGGSGDPTGSRTPGINSPPRVALEELLRFYNVRFAFNFSEEELADLRHYLMSL